MIPQLSNWNKSNPMEELQDEEKEEPNDEQKEDSNEEQKDDGIEALAV